MKRVWHFLRRYFAFLAVGATFLWAALAIAFYRAEQAPPGAVTLRIGHWQLEASVREALREMAADYRRGHPNVYIIQDAIPEMTYAQWLTTQLMGGTAPDMLQPGMVPYPLLVQYYNRYFVPLTRYVSRPNPYNRGTELEGVPFRSTFKDGMRNSYIEEVQEYMTVPLSQFGVRIFYNKDLLKKLTGLDEPPGEYRAFLAACEQIERHTDEKGQPYVAIAGSKYHLPWWEGPMMDPLTYPLLREADFNRDGFVGNDELFVAFRTGRVSFRHPAIEARFRMLREVTDHFQTGYTGLTRDEAVFLFAQQRAVFMTTGTWDARSLQEQARGTFEVGVMDFPMPARDDPYYGRIVEGPSYERLGGGFPFAVTRTCQHPEVAVDFLFFLASQPQNEKLNRIIGWIPAVKGAQMDAMLQAFEPHLQGVYGNFNIFLGGETWVRWVQLYSLYQVNQLSYDDLAAQYEPFYKEHGLKDFMDLQKDWRRTMHINEQFLAGIRASALMSEGAEAQSLWVKYRALTASRQVWPEIQHARQMKLVTGDIELPETGPYEYKPELLRKIAGLAAPAGASGAGSESQEDG